MDTENRDRQAGADRPTPPEDRCPGTLRLFPADDGGIARLRFPGGRLRPADWTALARVAAEHGGDLHLTSRGNIQVRGVCDEGLLRDRVAAAGWVPSPAHDRVRNVLASPLGGRLPGHADPADLPDRLDAALLDDETVTALSGRFLFGIDDSSGDVLAHSPDLAAVLDPAGGPARVVLAGVDTGLVVARADVPGVLVSLAAAFAVDPDGLWRVPASGPVHERMRAVLDSDDRTSPGPDIVLPANPDVPRVGWVDASDGTISLLAVTPFGVVPARLAEFLGAIDGPSTVSADRVIGLHGLTEAAAEQVVRVLAPMGLVFDQASPWVEVTACTGSDGCARSLTDVRYDAADAVAHGASPAEGRQHWVGCERGCGYPGTGSRVRATGDGYRVEYPGDEPEAEGT